MLGDSLAQHTILSTLEEDGEEEEMDEEELREAFVAGEITQEEFEERVGESDGEREMVKVAGDRV